MTMKQYAEMMGDADAELLQEAGDDVAYLTTQGYSPTEAIAKVASAARFPVEKTNLLTYAYTNGLAAEKRGSLGGPFQRLAEFEMPDPERIRKLVYGEAEPEQKTASVSDDPPVLDMGLFDMDPSRLDHDTQRAMFGLPIKTASGDDDTDENGKPVGKGFMFSRTTISIGLGSPCRSDKEADDTDTPQSLQDFMRKKIGTLTPEMSDDLETTLLKMLGEKKAGMIEANAEADNAFARACDSLDAFGSKIGHRHLNPTFKRAGLLSVNAYHPEIAALLGPYTDEVNGYLIKNASYDPVDINARHPWVAEAGRIQGELATVAELTVQANRKSAEYAAVCKLYRKRDTLRKSADWSSFLAKERVLYLIGHDQETLAILTDYLGQPVVGRLGVESSVGSSRYAAYTVMTEGIDLIELGVKPGDVVRTHYDFDLSGREVWKEYKVTEVVNAQALRLDLDPASVAEDQVSMAFELWRTQTNNDFADSIAATGGFDDMLVRYIYSDNADPNYSPIGPAAALVGLIGSVVPHQGVSWYPLEGLSVDGWINRFSNSQLNHMGGNGVLLITKHADGYICARHAVTTSKSPLAANPRTSLTMKMTEEMYVRNALLIKKEFRSVVKGFVGVSNNSPGTRLAIQANIEMKADQLKNDVDYPRLGGRITDGPDVEIRTHHLFDDRLVAVGRVKGPVPLNSFEWDLFI